MKSVNGIPILGLGTYGRTGPEGVQAISTALELGYRHLDTAQSYGTEPVIGEVLRHSGLRRDELFLTTKVATGNLAKDKFLPSLRKSLEDLGVDQVDLALVHWPSAGDAVPFADYVGDIGEAKRLGMARMIGVSNFPTALLARAEAQLGPGQIVNDQCEVHVFLQNRKLRSWCGQRGIAVTAYCPLAKGKVAEDPVLLRIAAHHGVIASQVALAWLMQSGIVAIPASSSRERMASNLAATLIELTPAEMAEIDALDRGQRIIAPAHGPAWD